ncbi:MAG: CvpA family protein [Sulfurospirillaceae bacterium]|nr:CvpA family protein [Sulfurospirillaceae bacterium]MDD3462392.1 CvpA family protein [Sulfurospirillaceae bacterium]
MENVSLFDIVSLSLILILGIKGVINGFIKEVFGLVGIVGGIYLASRYAEQAGLLINDYLYQFGNKASLYLFGFMAVLVLFWVISLFLGYILAQALKMSGLGAIDKIAGFIVGSAKIFLVFSILTVTLNNIEFIRSRLESYMAKSKMFPIFQEAGNYIVKLDTKQMISDSTTPKDESPKIK